MTAGLGDARALARPTHDRVERASVPWMELTPQGVRRSRRPLGERIRWTGSNLAKVRILIASNLRLDAFGTSLGKLWIVIEPLSQAWVYWVLIRIIGGVRGDAVGFFFVYSAITFWRSHAAMVGSSPNLLISRGIEVMQNNMPLQMLFYEFVGTEAALFVARLVVLFGFMVAGGITPSWTWSLALAIAVVQFLFSTALSMWLAMAGAFVRDIGKGLYVIVMLWWYVSPGLYGVNAIPEDYRTLYLLNPFAHLFPAMQSALIDGEVPDLVPLLVILGASVLLALAGARLLMRIRHRFFVLL